jgi:hypothetical protein
VHRRQDLVRQPPLALALVASGQIDVDMVVIAEAIIERRSGAFEPAGPSTALAFNMHASIMPLLESPVTLIEASTAIDGIRPKN